MKRIEHAPRLNWEARVEEKGMLYHTANGVPYWNEEAHYEFNLDQIEELEAATNELQEMCIAAVQHVIDERRFEELAIPEWMIPMILNSWERDDPAIYGRFDFSYDGFNAPKMLEYNADTPTSLVEAGLIQWFWLQDHAPNADQFNSIHEKLVGYWSFLRKYLRGQTLQFVSMDDLEDVATVTYLRDTAEQAGLSTSYISFDQLGFDNDLRRFVVARESAEPQLIDSIFKLYPWEWMAHEAYSDELIETEGKTQWIEPAWKMILSNKGILPILWELYTGHPNLLPSYRDQYMFRADEPLVVKPLLSREGANVSIIDPYGGNHNTSGEYGEEGVIYQAYHPLPDFGGYRPVIGSWVIGQESAGIGIRESAGPITDNFSRFVPHLFY